MDKYLIAIAELRQDIPFNFSYSLHYAPEAKEEYRFVVELTNNETENVFTFKGKSSMLALMSCYYYLLGLIDYYELEKDKN